MISDILQQLELPELGEPLPRPIIDAHTHVDTTQEYSKLSPEDNLKAARAVGVGRIVQVGCDVAGSQYAVKLAEANPQVVAAVAIHPNDAAVMSETELAEGMQTIETLAGAGDHVRAIGECGLDYFRTTEADAIEVQKRVFRQHVELALKYDLSLVIHSRRAEAKKIRRAFGDALAHVADILDETGWPKRTIFHCFTGDVEFAERALEAGAYLSYTGNVTYPANKHILESMLATPDDRLLVETDAPFLTPVPNRGRFNAPYLLPDTVRFIAEKRGQDLAEICDLTRANTFRAFGGKWGSDEDE